MIPILRLVRGKPIDLCHDDYFRVNSMLRDSPVEIMSISKRIYNRPKLNGTSFFFLFLIYSRQVIPQVVKPLGWLDDAVCHRLRASQDPGCSAEQHIIEGPENGWSRGSYCQCGHRTSHDNWPWHKSGKCRQLAQSNGRRQAKWPIVAGRSDRQRKGMSFLCSMKDMNKNWLQLVRSTVLSMSVSQNVSSMLAVQARLENSNSSRVLKISHLLGFWLIPRESLLSSCAFPPSKGVEEVPILSVTFGALQQNSTQMRETGI